MAEGSWFHRQAVVSSALVSCPGIFPVSDGLCWSPEQGNLDLQVKIYIQYTLTVIVGADFRLHNVVFFTNRTTFVESVGTKPPTGHPPFSLLFSVSPVRIDLCLLPGPVLNPKGHYNQKKKSESLQGENDTKRKKVVEKNTGVTEY